MVQCLHMWDHQPVDVPWRGYALAGFGRSLICTSSSQFEHSGKSGRLCRTDPRQQLQLVYGHGSDSSDPALGITKKSPGKFQGIHFSCSGAEHYCQQLHIAQAFRPILQKPFPRPLIPVQLLDLHISAPHLSSCLHALSARSINVEESQNPPVISRISSPYFLNFSTPNPLTDSSSSRVLGTLAAISIRVLWCIIVYAGTLSFLNLAVLHS